MTNQGDTSGEPALSFGPFRLFPTQRLLLETGKPLRLGSRALDLLIALVERPGELVSKEELMARVWPNTYTMGKDTMAKDGMKKDEMKK